MFKIFVVFALLFSAFSEEPLKQILQSPKATLNLYSNFKANEKLQYSGYEDRARFRLFRNNAKFIANAGDIVETATFGLNFFTSMTSDEKRQYLGLNITEHDERELSSDPILMGVKAPIEKLWTNEGAVTPAKNQGLCGSCWAFGAVGALETRYHMGSGVLRDFSEQEYLDCVYAASPKVDACNGGWKDRCFTYSQDNGGRLAATADYKYTGKKGTCLKGLKPDAMIAMKVTGYKRIGPYEAANIIALASGAISVAFTATDYIYAYCKGIMKDTSCKGSVNHAVTAVGYTEDFVLVKNSWGKSWGDEGFIKFARNFGNCGLFQSSSYPTLSTTGKTDSSPSDPATPYRPTTEVEPTVEPYPDCHDTLKRSDGKTCKAVQWMFCRKNKKDLARKYCAKTCHECAPKTDEECPKLTVRCADGRCRKSYMC